MTRSRLKDAKARLLHSPLIRSLPAVRRIVSFFEVSPWLVGGLALASILAGLLDAVVIALVVSAAAALAQHEHRVQINHIGYVSLPTALYAGMGIVVFGVGVGLIAGYLPVKIGADSGARLRHRVLGTYLRAPWSVQVGVRQGGFVDLLTQQTEQSTFFIVAFGATMGNMLIFLGMAAAAAVISPIAFGGVILVGVVLFIVMKPIAKFAQRRAKIFSRVAEQFAVHVDTVVTMAEEINVYGVGETIRGNASGSIDGIRRERTAMDTAVKGINSSYQDIATMGLIATLLVLTRIPHLNLASLGAVVIILLRAMGAGQAVQTGYSQMRQQLPFVRTLQGALKILDSEAPPSGRTPLADIETIELRDVRFGYVPSVPVLRGATVTIERGELVAVVGPSGAGKSTLLQILLRLRTPDSGEFLVNGKSASSYSPESWTLRVAYVPQDSRVLHASVADNIRFFREISMEDVIAAAKMAQIDSNIAALPDGYETLIGQRVDAFSGGQRQRLCLARALAGKPQVLILDEPTSALDDVSEHLVHGALGDLRGSVTMIVVAHRPGILKFCDRILTVRDGKIEGGRHGRTLAGTGEPGMAAAGDWSES